MKLRALGLLPYKIIKIWSLLLINFGWLRSYVEQRSIDRDGNPVPWYSYAAIEYLNTLDLKNSRIFEYGCGGSSVFWSERAQEVIAAENDSKWASIVNSYAIKNLKVVECSDRQEYINLPEVLGGNFDMVVIDGRYRHDCIYVASRVVSQTGIIVLDNADWYPDACDALRSLDWFQVDFSGFGPINAYCTTTSIFIKAHVHLTRKKSIRPIGGLANNGDKDD